MRILTVLILLAAVGCEKASSPTASVPPSSGKAPVAAPDATDDVAVERAKLSPEDRKLVDAQEWCANSTDERLGEMGPPIKLTIKGEPVFICCKGCQKKVEGNPDKALATVAELKAKKAAAKP